MVASSPVWTDMEMNAQVLYCPHIGIQSGKSPPQSSRTELPKAGNSPETKVSSSVTFHTFVLVTVLFCLVISLLILLGGFGQSAISTFAG